MNTLQSDPAFQYFFALNLIPRCSGKEKAVADYLEAFAQENRLNYTRDGENNLILRRQTPSPNWIALQAHVDMVCLKSLGNPHDFEKEPIIHQLIGDALYATGTTLGGDNGLGAGWMLAFLTATDYEGPSLECLFTTNEEEGMTGAAALNLQDLQASQMINLDTEEEGVFYVSCAGGVLAQQRLSLATKERKGILYTITIQGLLGGHSGIDIHLGHKNALKLAGEFLQALLLEYPTLGLVSLTGGSKHNAIPTAAKIEVLFPHAKWKEFDHFLSSLSLRFREEQGSLEPSLSITWTLSKEVSKDILFPEGVVTFLSMVESLPYGVIAMDKDLSKLVETSANLGVIEWHKSEISFLSSLRSSKDEALSHLKDQYLSIDGKFQTFTEFLHPYPAWPFQKNSPLQKKVLEIYQEFSGKEGRLSAIHAGLECGYFIQKKPMLDIISIGPSINHIHTPMENASVSSVRRVFHFLRVLLKELA